MKWVIGIIILAVVANIYAVTNGLYTIPYAIAHCIILIPTCIFIAWQRGDICPFDNPPTDDKG